MNVAKSHPYNRDAASILFKNNFPIKTLKFDRERFFSKSLYDQNNDINYMLNILDSFGHLISSLKVDYSYLNNKQTAQFNRIISRTSFDSLIEIDLRHCDSRKLKALPKPLSKVEVVRLRGQMKVEDIDLGELFPVASSINVNDVLYVEGPLANDDSPDAEAEKGEEFIGPIGFLRKLLNSWSK